MPMPGKSPKCLHTLKSGQYQSSKPLHYASTTHASAVESHIRINPLLGRHHSITGSLVINSLLLLVPPSETDAKLGEHGLPQNQDDGCWQPASCSMYIALGITNANALLSLV
ncbi:hypothetical protein FPOAC1_003087 [Fusarium poae]|uniref:hypothetical protein n=1 Tax=Fusarium poae TaxID=36050 RepID=UPI001CE8C435|nr:hypothetical protein FPOAC1_003087 [Fusarium poae]KAG8677076.1 hypothetical protein FPOAC1_003087 [Fusarium poae]